MVRCKFKLNYLTFHSYIKNIYFHKDAFVDFIITNYVNMIIHDL